MKWIKPGLITVAALAAVLYLTGLLLPSELEVTERKTIQADATAVTTLLATPKTWESWSPWNSQKMPQMTSTFEGPDSGPGSRWVWKDPEHGDGTLEITEVTAGASVGYELRFTGFEPMFGTVGVASAEGGLDVTWSTRWDTGGGAFMSWMILLMEDTVRSEYIAAIEGLEKASAAAP